MSFRRELPALVAEAHTMGSLAVIRSLGRAGYPVFSYSTRPDAIGFRSRYSQASLRPAPYSAPDEFVAWLCETVKQHGIRTFIPSERALLALRDDFEQFAPIMPFSQCRASVYHALSKFDLFAGFESLQSGSALRRNLPPYILLQEGEPLPDGATFDALGDPVFAKIDGTYARPGQQASVKCLRNGADLPNELSRLLQNQARRVLVQGFVPGVGLGVFFVRWQGNVLAHFGHRRLHEVPHRGGASSYRRAWWHEAVYKDALLRLETMDWEGPAMFEYRWDPETDRFYLIELNARFWGSLHLAMYAGVDFPRLLVDAMHGHPERIESFDLNQRCRWTFPREMEYVLSCVRDKELPLTHRLWPCLEFFLLFLDPRVRDDSCFPGDRMLYLHSIPRAIKYFLS